MPKKAAKPKAKPGNLQTLKPGWWVAVTLKPDTAPLRSYVGQIMAVDSQGIRITLVDWLTGMARSWDLFIPYNNLESALIATEDHNLEGFGDAAGKWQTQMDEGQDKAEAAEA